MIPINIYSLTRVDKVDFVQKLEKQMSRRSYVLTVKKWEIQSLKKLSEHLCNGVDDMEGLLFYYSFRIPKLGKEFDLLRISDTLVLNIELKSGKVSDEKVKNQLLQNRYYLSLLGKPIHSYTYISSENRLVRLTNGKHLVEADWQELYEDIDRQKNCYKDNLEELFKEEQFLISPLTDPDRFLRGEYFLTAQQKDIKVHILKNIKNHTLLFQGFTGLPGTGKTLLLYDLAKELSRKQCVCVLHFGSFPEELAHLNRRLKRVDFYSCNGIQEFPNMDKYAVILIDEGHRITPYQLQELVSLATAQGKPILFSYDCEDAISVRERKNDISVFIEQLNGFEKFRLTNRIRMNRELSTFIRNIMKAEQYHNNGKYPSVSVAYANNREEALKLLSFYKKKGYIYIRDCRQDIKIQNDGFEIDTGMATCREFDNVVMLMDDSFYYDEEHYLRSKYGVGKLTDSPVRELFQGLNRGKQGLAIVVLGNESLFAYLLSVLQG